MTLDEFFLRLELLKYRMEDPDSTFMIICYSDFSGDIYHHRLGEDGNGIHVTSINYGDIFNRDLEGTIRTVEQYARKIRLERTTR